MKPAVSKLNKEWHQAHVMPKNASLDQRIEWHLQHRQHCSCRDIPEKLKNTMREKGFNFSTRWLPVLNMQTVTNDCNRKQSIIPC